MISCHGLLKIDVYMYNAKTVKTASIYGIYRYPYRHIYEGEWLDDKKNGQGKYRCQSSILMLQVLSLSSRRSHLVIIIVILVNNSKHNNSNNNHNNSSSNHSINNHNHNSNNHNSNNHNSDNDNLLNTNHQMMCICILDLVHQY